MKLLVGVVLVMLMVGCDLMPRAGSDVDIATSEAGEFTNDLLEWSVEIDPARVPYGFSSILFFNEALFVELPVRHQSSARQQNPVITFDKYYNEVRLDVEWGIEFESLCALEIAITSDQDMPYAGSLGSNAYLRSDIYRAIGTVAGNSVSIPDEVFDSWVLLSETISIEIISPIQYARRAEFSVQGLGDVIDDNPEWLLDPRSIGKQ